MTEVKRQNLVIAISLSTLLTALGTAFMVGVKSTQYEARLRASVTATELYVWERRTEAMNPGWRAGGIIEVHERINGSDKKEKDR